MRSERGGPMGTMVRKRNARRRFAGVTLLEVALGLGLLSLGLVAGGRALNENAQATRAASAAGRLGEVSSAASDYVRANRTALLALAPVAGQPISIPAGRTVPGGAIPTGPGGLTSIQGGGFLPSTFVDQNNYGQNHRLLVRQRTAGALEFMVAQVGGRTIPDQDLSRVTQRIGASGGAALVRPPAAVPAGTVLGTGGGWRTTVAEWTAADGTGPTVGRATVSNTFMQSTALADYLYRSDIGIPEANRMRTDLDMGGAVAGGTARNINGANNITAAGTVTSGRSVMQNGGYACAGNVSGCTFWISDDGGLMDQNDGWIRLVGGAPSSMGLAIQGPGNASLYVQNDATISRDLYTSRNAIVGNQLTVNGYATFAQDAQVGRNLGVNVDVNIGQNLGVAGTANVVGNISTGSSVYATGSVNAAAGMWTGGNLGVAGDTHTNRLWSNYIASNGNMDVGANLGVAGSVGVNGNIGVGGSVTAAYLRSTGNIQADNDLFVNNNASVGNTLTVGANIRAGDSVIANNRVIGNNGVQTGLVAVVNTGCGDYGMIARNNSDGAILFCEAGVWRSPGAPFTNNVAAWAVGSGFGWTNDSAKSALVNVNGNSSGRCNATSYVNGVVMANVYTLMSGGSSNCAHNVVVPPGGSYYLTFGNNMYSADVNVWR